jgi:hypothetical protein
MSEEERSSFVRTNVPGTILFCQSPIENLLAAFRQTGLMMDALAAACAFARQFCPKRRQTEPRALGALAG